MKQIVKIDKNYNEIEYYEVDDKGKVVYALHTKYYPNSDLVKHKIDSNKWERFYHTDGTIYKEFNKPYKILEEYDIFGGWEITTNPCVEISITGELDHPDQYTNNGRIYPTKVRW